MASGSNASTLSHCAASPSPTRTDRRRYRFPLADVFGSAFLPRLPKNAHSIVIALRPHCVVPPVPLRDPLFWPIPPFATVQAYLLAAAQGLLAFCNRTQTVPKLSQRYGCKMQETG